MLSGSHFSLFHQAESLISSNECNIAQNTILKKLRAYLRAQTPARDPEFIKTLKNGYCTGFSVLAGYALWLTLAANTEDKKEAIERDDWSWFYHTLQFISQLNPLAVTHEYIGIERLLSLIEAFQHSMDYEKIAYHSVDKISDTKNHEFREEYTLAGLFTAEDLIKIFPSIFAAQDRIIFIISNNHSTCLIHHEECYYFYDPNLPGGLYHFTQEDSSEFIELLFRNLEFEPTTPSPLAFKIYCEMTAPIQQYPLQRELLNPQRWHHPASSALHMAAKVGCIASLNIYLQAGADVNAVDEKGHTACSIACYRGYSDLVATLAVIESNLSTSEKGLELLKIAIIRRQLGVIQALLAAGVNANKAHQSSTPLLRVTTLNYIEAIPVLIGGGADINLLYINTTPLIQACFDSHPNTVRTLIQHGANVNQRNSEGLTPAYVCVMKNNLDALKILAEYGANINVADEDGITPLMVATEDQLWDIVRFIESSIASKLNCSY